MSSRALQGENSISPLFPGPVGAIAENDQCVIYSERKDKVSTTGNLGIIFHIFS